MKKSIKDILIKLKLYFDRGRTYLGMISFSGTAFLVITQLQLIGIDIDITNYTFLAIMSVIAITLLVGFFEVKFMFFSKDLEVRGRKNPLWKELFDRLDRIEKKQKELEDK